MKTVDETINIQGHFNHWLVELLFGVVGALVVLLLFALSINDSLAKQVSSYSSQRLSTEPSSTLIQVGSASMSLLWLDIYSAKLYSIDGQYHANQLPLKLDIEYHREISAVDLIEATVEQWQHLGISETQINQYREQLIYAWPNVKEGDRLTFLVHASAQAAFLFNDVPYYQVSDPQFSTDFLAIWLSENTSHPKLRKQLIGMN
ncbi:chalcone isomerase family protein [Shewanella sp. A14]